jgi:hypothetical protein
MYTLGLGMNKTQERCQKETREPNTKGINQYGGGWVLGEKRRCIGKTQRIYIRSDKKLLNVGTICMWCHNVVTTI